MADLTAAGQSFIGERHDAGPTVRFYAVAEAPLPGLVHWLERQKFDLVAVGSHGRRGVRRFLLGSVAEAVARRAPCSTLIARGALDEVMP
jgi:nucleotide-binding universal stress UspA family protein